jgi:hypothetical protein
MFVKVVRCAFLVVIRRFKLSGQYMRKIEVRGRRDKGGSRNGLKVKWTPTYVYSTESMPLLEVVYSLEDVLIFGELLRLLHDLVWRTDKHTQAVNTTYTKMVEIVEIFRPSYGLRAFVDISRTPTYTSSSTLF